MSPSEEEKRIQVRIINKNYQTSKEGEGKGEKKQREKIIEAEPILDITHIYND